MSAPPTGRNRRRVTYLAPVPDRQPEPPRRVRLTGWQRMQVEGIRKLLMDAPGIADLGTPRQAYLAGLLEGATSALLDVLDTITDPGGDRDA